MPNPFEPLNEAIRQALIDAALRDVDPLPDASPEDLASDVAAMVEAFGPLILAWKAELESGALQPEEFASLVRGQRDLAVLAALNQAGHSAITLDKIRAVMIDALIAAAGAVA